MFFCNHSGFEIHCDETKTKFAVKVVGVCIHDHWRVFESLEEAKESAEKLGVSREKILAQEEKQKETQAKEEKEKTEFDAYYAYLNEKTPMQKQRAINHLERTVKYEGKCMTNAEMVEKCLSEGKKPTYMTFKGKQRWVMQSDTGTFVEVSKTQYEHAIAKIN